MNAKKLAFDAVAHDRLLELLAGSDYIERYLSLCTRYRTTGDVTGPRLDMGKTAEIFQSNGVTMQWDKRFKVFTFDRETVSGWCWETKLVVQRHDMLEPMLDASSGSRAIGSTWLNLAFDAGKLRHPPMPHTVFLPPAIPVNRPQFDGDMRTMERMVPDLVELFRWTKSLVRSSWTDQPDNRNTRSPALA